MSAARDAEACLRYDRWLTAYLDTELDAVHLLEVEDHLEACESCREYLAMLRATRGSLQNVARAVAPESLRRPAVTYRKVTGLVAKVLFRKPPWL